MIPYDIEIANGEPIAAAWPKDINVAVMGPGILVVDKTVRPCPNVTMLTQYETHENYVDDMVFSSWSTLAHVYMLPDSVPNPYMKWWEGEKEFVVVFDHPKYPKSVLTSTGKWDEGAILLVPQKSGEYAYIKQKS